MIKDQLRAALDIHKPGSVAMIPATLGNAALAEIERLERFERAWLIVMEKVTLHSDSMVRMHLSDYQKALGATRGEDS